MDHRRVYDTDSRGYQALVEAEDVDGNLRATLRNVAARPQAVVEVGAGTGRVTRILRSLGHEVAVTEPVRGMLGVAVELAASDRGARFCQAEAAHLPFRAGAFDAAVAGWVFGHQREWHPSSWRQRIGSFLAECDRVTDAGLVVVIETLGTGYEEPNPPSALNEYYEWLEAEHSFRRSTIRTDYAFPTVEDAAAITSRFFGAGFARRVRQLGWSRVPECTGIWVRRPISS